MTPIRVCFLIASMSDGGAQKQCIYLLNELQKRTDVEAYVLYFYPGVHDSLLKKERLRIIQVPVSSNYDPRILLLLRRELKRIRPHVLVSWLHACDIYSYFLRSCVPDLRWILTERNSFYDSDPRFWLRRLLGRNADAIVANSERGRAYWKAAGAKGRCYVIPNVVHQALQDGSDTRSHSAVFVGRLEPQKNVTTLVRAFCILASRRPEFNFIVVGEGSLRVDLEEIVDEAGLNCRVHFPGFQADVNPYLKRAGTVVSLSHYEGLPNVLLESVAVDAMIVASDIPEHRELLGPDYPFYVQGRHNAHVCADLIERALDQGKLPEALSFARDRISKMNATAVADAYIDVFRTVSGVAPC